MNATDTSSRIRKFGCTCNRNQEARVSFLLGSYGSQQNRIYSKPRFRRECCRVVRRWSPLKKEKKRDKNTPFTTGDTPRCATHAIQHDPMHCARACSGRRSHWWHHRRLAPHWTRSRAQQGGAMPPCGDRERSSGRRTNCLQVHNLIKVLLSLIVWTPQREWRRA